MNAAPSDELQAAIDAAWLNECDDRSPVQIWGTRGMVSSMHPTCSQVGADVLRRGGNAFDAAVAMGATISVLSPDWAGPAGDSAWLIYHADTREYAYLDGYSTCPAAVSPERIARHFGLDAARDAHIFEEEPADERHVGMITAMIPGTPAAWVELARRYGSLPLEALFEAAIDIAASSFPINAYLADGLRAYRGKIEPFPFTRRIFFNEEGEVLGEGERLRQTELAETLSRLARGGHDGFYKGETAARIVEHSERHGGLLKREDLARYQCAGDRSCTAPTAAGKSS